MTRIGRFLLALGVVLAPAAAMAEQIEFRYRYDHYTDRATALDGMVGVAALREIGPGLRFGPELYSAASGDAGGLFVGGLALEQRWRLGPNLAFEIGGFVGGGGGAALVPGDGLMTRAHATLYRNLGRGYALGVGLAHIDITGSPVSTPALSFTLTREIAFAASPSWNGPLAAGRRLRAIKPVIKQFHPQSNLQRSGTPLEIMTLGGFEATFAAGPEARRESFIQMTGALAGDGEGYADFQLGYRWLSAPAGFRGFSEVALGFGGGGDVDTGGGLLLSVGAGFALPLSKGLDLEAGAQLTHAPTGDFTALTPFARAVLRFGREADPNASRRWRLSYGLTRQSPHEGFRRDGVTAMAAPVLIEYGLDYLLSERAYVSIYAQTVASGDAGGYAVGLFGLGNRWDLWDRTGLSLEAHLGAAGGGGINTQGGLVGAVRAEFDYRLNDSLALVAGLGQMRTLRSSGARPVTLHLGIRNRFRTFH